MSNELNRNYMNKLFITPYCVSGYNSSLSSLSSSPSSTDFDRMISPRGPVHLRAITKRTDNVSFSMQSIVQFKSSVNLHPQQDDHIVVKQQPCSISLSSLNLVQLEFTEKKSLEKRSQNYDLTNLKKKAAELMKTQRIVFRCKFCQNNNEDADVYKCHPLRDTANRVVCPILRDYTCPICKANGDSAHTIKYCPVLKRQLKADRIRKYARQL